jgi:hypothetical protein
VVNRSPSSPSTQPTATTSKGVRLSDYDNKSAIVSVTTIGPLVGEEQRKAIRLSVTPTERRLEILDGYEQNVTNSYSFPNTQDAYQYFLRGLNNAGFIRSKKTTITDYRGYCPFGRLYVYDLSYSGDHISNLRSGSCMQEGSFAGNGPTIRQLFQAQIPSYSKLVRDVKV